MLIDAIGIGRMFNDGTKALNEATFRIEEGKFTAILGPSGCGKSTLLRLISGLDFVTAGTLDWPNGKPENHEIGFVFQDPTLMPWATVWDNIFLPLRLSDRTRADATDRIAEVISLVELEGFEDARPHQLSGGMRMRVSIARALVMKPRILLMDEPFAALDEMTRFRLNDDLLRIVSEIACTVLFVTHSVFEAAYLADKVLVMSPRPGRISGEVPIDYDRARTADLRNSADYAARCGAITDRLRRAAS